MVDTKLQKPVTRTQPPITHVYVVHMVLVYMCVENVGTVLVHNSMAQGTASAGIAAVSWQRHQQIVGNSAGTRIITLQLISTKTKVPKSTDKIKSDMKKDKINIAIDDPDKDST